MDEEITAQEYGLETIDERLRSIEITKILCLGSKIAMTAEKILGKMPDRQIVKMFDGNIDVQYILLDRQEFEGEVNDG
ncbi:MAG: hypothetical protein MUP81_00155 [Dehalococcoidia bacterium]|nr:hypothetical protein [Dehalococcoidia bacterium]